MRTDLGTCTYHENRPRYVHVPFWPYMSMNVVRSWYVRSKWLERTARTSRSYVRPLHGSPWILVKYLAIKRSSFTFKCKNKLESSEIMRHKIIKTCSKVDNNYKYGLFIFGIVLKHLVFYFQKFRHFFIFGILRFWYFQGQPTTG